MAEVASFLGPALQVVEWVIAPVIRQFNYLCCFTANIKSLKDEAEKLDNEARGLQDRVDAEIDNVQVILPQVETWLKESSTITNQKNAILVQVLDVESGCLKLVSRFSLSKKAKKTTHRMKELRGECKFDVISREGPSAATQKAPLESSYQFESRKQIEEDLMTTLRGGDVSMIGMCGMGGLGKTTMAKKIMNRVLEEHVFQEAVIAVVSQQVDKSKIQDEIGGQLGLKLRDEASEDVRLKKLHARLSETKKTLLVLDDVWETLKLEDLGIPRDSKGCTILITSRNKDALSGTGCSVENIFGMKVLADEDAWLLFSGVAGTCVDDPNVNSIAKPVVKECNGLPIALASVGATLKDEKDARIWKDALEQLRHCELDVPDYIEKVYNPIKLSYDALKSQQAKSLFLLCCLFPEDADINVEQLTLFGMGLGIFKDMRNLDGARNRMSKWIRMFKNRSLLLDSRYTNKVRMHDVVRDVCIFIAKQEGYIGGSDCTWISSLQRVGERIEFDTSLGFPNLHLLFLSRSPRYNSVNGEFEFNSAFLEGIRDLNVLYIEYYYSMKSLPHTIESSKNLKSLVLESCRGLRSISVVGELVNLEILICRECNSVMELPEEIQGLNRLKLLELTECRNLQRIGRGIVSSLVGLEELKMLGSFERWEAEDSELKQNARLRELEALTNLRRLEIVIQDHALAREKMQLSSKIERFQIKIGNSSLPNGAYDKKLSLELKGETLCLGDWIEKQLLRETRCLSLSGDGANNVQDLAKSENIRWLELENIATLQEICDTTYLLNLEGLQLSNLKAIEQLWKSNYAPLFTNLSSIVIDDCPRLHNLGQFQELHIQQCKKLVQEGDEDIISSHPFHNLKELHLSNLAALKQLWKSSENNYVQPLFSNLSDIFIGGCPGLLNLGLLSVGGKDSLPQLKVLKIERCEKMEQVFLFNKGDENENNIESRKIFPQLHHVILRSLPNLETFHQGIEGIEFPLLMAMHISGCPKMKSIASNRSAADIDDDDYSHFFHQSSFGRLKDLVIGHNPFCGHEIPSLFIGLEELTITEYHGSMGLFTLSVAGNTLVSLRELCIKQCYEMVKVIENEEEKVVSGIGQRAILFPKLGWLALSGLPKLVNFGEWKGDVELPSLRHVSIKRCPNMQNFCLGSVVAPNLKAFETDLNIHLDVNVSFNAVELLSIQENEYPLYHHKFFSPSFFSGLEELFIFMYLSSMSLLSSSIARNLVSLKRLDITFCFEMVQVITEEEEKVESGGQMTHLFPKLKYLSLEHLPKLMSFLEWKSDVELPSLENVFIYGCPDMQCFGLGSVTTPNLKYVKIDNEKFGAIEGLNGVLQQVHLARAKKKQEAEKNEEESSKEHQEAKGEIEDQN